MDDRSVVLDRDDYDRLIRERDEAVAYRAAYEAVFGSIKEANLALKRRLRQIGDDDGRSE